MILITTPTWQQTYPGASVGALAMTGLSNPAFHPALEDRKLGLQAELRARFGEQDDNGQKEAIRALPVIQAYNDYYRRFNKTYHVQLQLESVVLKGKPILSVASLVEAMFMAELENLLLTAGHDLDILQLPVTVDVAKGSEVYTLLRGSEQELKPGDMFMADGQGIISSIIYGPDQRTQITPQTQRALFTVYAPPGISPEDVRRHLETLRDYLILISPEAEVSELTVLTA